MKKKLLALLLTGCLVLSLFAFASCQGGGGSPAGGTSGVGETSGTGDASGTGDTSDTQPSEGTQAGSGTVQGLRRLKQMILKETEDGKVVTTVDFTWEDNGVYISGESDNVEQNARLLYDSETKSLNYTEGDLFSELFDYGLLFQYGDGQKIVKLGANSADVVYGENKLTVKDASPERYLEYDPDSKTVRALYGSGITRFGTVYELDEKGHIIKTRLDVKFVLDTHDGKFVESSSEGDSDVILNYDEFGNLVKIYTDSTTPDSEFSICFEYKYYDEPIKQTWEETVPYFICGTDPLDSFLLFGLLEQ